MRSPHHYEKSKILVVIHANGGKTRVCFHICSYQSILIFFMQGKWAIFGFQIMKDEVRQDFPTRTAFYFGFDVHFIFGAELCI